MDMFKELLKKKQSKGEMDPKHKEAKMGVLKEIRDMAAGDMGDEIKGMKKVTVAAPDRKGLEEGLDRAEDMVKSPILGQEMEGNEENPSTYNEHSQSVDKLDAILGDDCTSEDIDKLMSDLKARKENLSKKSE